MTEFTTGVGVEERKSCEWAASVCIATAPSAVAHHTRAATSQTRNDSRPPGPHVRCRESDSVHDSQVMSRGVMSPSGTRPPATENFSVNKNFPASPERKPYP